MQFYMSPVGNLDKVIYIHKNIFGFVLTPTDDRLFFPYRHIIDNDAYRAYIHKKPYDINPFLKMLDVDRGREPDFVVIPDIVAGGLASLQYSIDNIDKISRKYKRYLPVQDGIEPHHVTDSRIVKAIDGIFVGGSKHWKRRTFKMWIEFAHSYKLPCHIARFGTWDRWQEAYDNNADSVDSSNPARHAYIWKQLLDFYHTINPDIMRLS